MLKQEGLAFIKALFLLCSFPGTSEGAEDSSRFEQEEEEDSGGRREPRHHAQS